MTKKEQKNSSFFHDDYEQIGDLKCLIDWCQFTLPYTLPLDEVFHLLGIPKEEFKLMEKNNLLGYTIHYSCGHVKVLSEGATEQFRYEMGHHVVMSGQACREFELYNGNRWYDFLQSILDLGGHFTRFDSAIDDFKGYFKIPNLVKKIKKGELTSKFKRCKRIEDILIKDGSTKGTTLYYGRSTSDIQIYMYEKNYEQREELLIPVWNRTELRMRDDRATMFVMQILSTRNIAKSTLGVISNYLTFKDSNSSDSNKSRWKVSRFWTKFLNDAEKVSLTTKKPDRSMEDKFRWLERQVKKSLAMVNLVEPEMLEEFVKEGMLDIDSKDEMLIDAYLKMRQEIEDSLYDKKVEKAKAILEPRKVKSNDVLRVYSSRNNDDVNQREGIRSDSYQLHSLKDMLNDDRLGQDISKDKQKDVQGLVSKIFVSENNDKKNSPSLNEKD